MRKIIIALLIVISLVALLIAMNPIGRPPSTSGKLRIVTTLFPLYDFVSAIGRDKTEVSSLLPPGVEPHAFEPRPSDVVRINRADLFIYTGKFMEPWVDDIIKGVVGRQVAFIDASRGIWLKPGGEKAGSFDPHIWLDFSLAQKMVDNVALALAERDPANAAFYKKNTADYKAKLVALDNNFRAALARCRKKKIVYGGHYAFGYLTKRYGLEYLAAQGLAPDAEPTAGDLAKLVDQINRHQIKYIFYEELTSPKIAETLASETKARLLKLNAAHNLTKEDYNRHATFISLMRANLENLKIGLEYQ
jgi:zinc transport system substrate-binding protein